MKKLFLVTFICCFSVGTGFSEIAYGESDIFALGSGGPVSAGLEKKGPAESDISMKVAPNPFNPYTQIIVNCNSPEKKDITLKIYALNGRLVRSLYSGRLAQKSIFWDGRDNTGKKAVSGIYFIKMTTGNMQILKKVLLLK